MAIQTLLPYDLNDRAQASRAAQDLATGLEGLLSSRLQKMNKKQQAVNQAQALSAAGIPQEQAILLAQADPQTQQLILKNYLQAAEGTGLEQALGGLSGFGGFQGAPSQNNQMQQVMGALQGGNPQDMIMRNLMQGLGQQQQQSQMGPQSLQQQPGLPQQQENNLADILKRPRLNPQQRLKIEEMKQRERIADRKLAHADKKIDAKETLETFNSTVDQYKSAKESNSELARFEKLIKNGKLPHPTTASAIDFLKKGIPYLGVGIDFSGLLSGDAQEFDKISRSMLRQGKEIFGSRLTNFDVDTFLKMIPSLVQSNEGKQRVINTMKAFNDAALLRYDAMRDIIRKNDNKRPSHLNLLIEEKIEKKLDDLHSKFVDGYGPKNPPAQSRSIIQDIGHGLASLLT